MNRNIFNIVLVLLGMTFASVAYAQDASCPDGYICTKSDTSTSANTESTTTVISPPPSAISPSINSSNSDLCTIGVAGAVQTQILGISAGTVFTEENCLRLKNAKVLYDMGMKVAAVSVMCEDPGVFNAMMNAGTPCPYDGLVGAEARAAWMANQDKQPEEDGKGGFMGGMNEAEKSTLGGIGAVGGMLLLLLAL